MKHWFFVVAFALVFYINGAGFVESFVNYPSWALLSSGDFAKYHRFVTPRIIGLLVVPVLLATAFTMLLLWRRPSAVPLWAVSLALVLQAVPWVSTAVIQYPIQAQLSQGFSAELLGRLIETKLWLRRVPIALCALLFAWLAARTLSASDPSPGNRKA